MAAAEVPAERRVTLADGTTVSDEDAIITRRNDRRLTLSASDWVANGDRWTITSVRPDGALEVRHARSRRRVTLPADYVAQHVQLGYACTVHPAQGQTVDTSHTVLTGTESRQLLYVALTRARHANHLYLDVSIGSEDAVLDADAVRPPTAIEVLTRAIERDDSAASATSTRREERDPVPQLHKACVEYLDALGVAAESVLDPRASPRSRLAPIPPSPASPTARHGQRSTPSSSGSSSTEATRTRCCVTRRCSSVATGPVTSPPSSPAASRPTNARQDGCHGCRPSRAGSPRTTSGAATSIAAANSSSAMGTAVRAAATSWTQETAPAWAVPTLSDPNLTRDLAIWRAARDIPDTDLRPTGPGFDDHPGKRVQRRLDRRVAEAGGLQATLEPAAARLAETVHPGITAHPQWPTLAHQIAAADHIGIDRAELRRIATGRPLPIEQPAAALAYRLIDAIGERPASAPAQPPKPAPVRPYEPRPAAYPAA